MSDVKCPYCNAEVGINHDDGYGYDENGIHAQYCWSCKKSFAYTTTIVFYYDVEKADCIDDGNHDLHPTHVCPKFLTKMRCKTCGYERKPTESERLANKIPTYEEYIKETESEKLKELK